MQLVNSRNKNRIQVINIMSEKKDIGIRPRGINLKIKTILCQYG